MYVPGVWHGNQFFCYPDMEAERQKLVIILPLISISSLHLHQRRWHSNYADTQY